MIKGELSISELQQYVNSIQVSVRKWHAIHFPSCGDDLREEVSSHLEKLERLGRGAFEPLVMAAMQVASDDAGLSKFLSAAERFVFLIGRLSQRRSDTGDSEFYRLAGQLYRNDKTLTEAVDIVNLRTNFHFSAEKASANMRDLFQRGNGFYIWEGLRYFLFEYEQHLKQKAQMETPRSDWEILRSTKKDHVSIEHIYPISPLPGEWLAFEARSERERAVLQNSLGNLLALSQQRNSRLSNRSFARKREDEDNVRGYSNGSYSEIDVAKRQDWTPHAVLGRGLAMLDFLEKRWSVSLGSRTEKVKLLNLEFLEPTDA